MPWGLIWHRPGQSGQYSRIECISTGGRVGVCLRLLYILSCHLSSFRLGLFSAITFAICYPLAAPQELARGTGPVNAAFRDLRLNHREATIFLVVTTNGLTLVPVFLAWLSPLFPFNFMPEQVFLRRFPLISVSQQQYLY